MSFSQCYGYKKYMYVCMYVYYSMHLTPHLVVALMPAVQSVTLRGTTVHVYMSNHTASLWP